MANALHYSMLVNIALRFRSDTSVLLRQDHLKKTKADAPKRTV